jgi:hypothetical protein
MRKDKFRIIKNIIVLITIFSIGAGSSLSMIDDSLRLIIFQEHLNDIEVQHHHNLHGLADDENFIVTEKANISTFLSESEEFQITLNFISQDYSGNIWQPPRYI